MNDPMSRLSAADPEHGRDVPPTPPFYSTAPTASPWRGPLRALAIAAVIVLGVGIPVWLLSGPDVGPVSPAATTTSTEPSSSTAAGETTTTSPPSTTSTEPLSTTDTTPDGSGEPWPGEAFDFWVPTPVEGPVIGVVGVAYDDVLNVRNGPGVDFDVIARLNPTTDGISATGAGWQLASGDVWWEITADGWTGWANQRYLTRLGGVFDATSTVVDRLGAIPEAESMDDLADLVVRAFADFDYTEAGGRVETVVAATEGDLAEVTVDLVGVADDSIGGFRLHVFAEPLDDGSGYALKSVEATTFCMRGLDGDVCV